MTFRTKEHNNFEMNFTLPDKLERCHCLPHRDTQLEILFHCIQNYFDQDPKYFFLTIQRLFLSIQNTWSHNQTNFCQFCHQILF